MSIEHSLKRLQEIAQQLPREGCVWEKRPTFKPGATEELLYKFQTASSAVPADLMRFLRQGEEVIAMGVHNGYRIGGLHWMSSYRPEMQPAVESNNLIPVASDGGGNVFLVSRSSGHVLHWDHETRKLAAVANSFADFLARVVSDWEHYVSDERNWKYLV
jgi:SMI1-KNR4 cell-wall